MARSTSAVGLGWDTAQVDEAAAALDPGDDPGVAAPQPLGTPVRERDGTPGKRQTGRASAAHRAVDVDHLEAEAGGQRLGAAAHVPPRPRAGMP